MIREYAVEKDERSNQYVLAGDGRCDKLILSAGIVGLMGYVMQLSLM